MKYYPAIERNKVKLILVRWLNLKPVVLSEVSQKENINTVSDQIRSVTQ